MIKIEITKEFEYVGEAQNFLREIVFDLNRGIKSGDEWRLIGESEDDQFGEIGVDEAKKDSEEDVEVVLDPKPENEENSQKEPIPAVVGQEITAKEEVENKPAKKIWPWEK